MVNSSVRKYKYKHICTQLNITKVRETKTDRNESKLMMTGDFNIAFPLMDRKTINFIVQPDLKNTCKTFHTTKEATFFSKAY